MTSGIVPIVGSRGKFKLLTPFTIDAGLEYTCAAVRTFVEINRSNIDIYKAFYEPRGLSKGHYEDDIKAQVVIVVLLGDRKDFIYVPSSYIGGVPDSNGYSYTRRLYNLDLGMMHNEVNLDLMIDNIKGTILNMAGVVATVTQLQVPVVEIVNETAHQAIEAGRNGQVTNRSGYEELYRQEASKVQSLLVENQRMAAKLVELGVIQT